MSESVRAWVVGSVAFFSMALLSFGCRQGAIDEPESRASALSNDSATLSVVLPPGGDPATFVLAANGSLLLDDRAVVDAPISNMGGSGTGIGNDAKTAAISCPSKVTVLDRAVVSGRVDTGVPIAASTSSRIAGPVNVHAVFTPAVVRKIAVIFPGTADTDIILQSTQIASKPPGRYRNIKIYSGSRLKLQSGTYYAETIDIEPQAILDLDEQHGPVVIYVKQLLAYRGSIVSNMVGPNFLMGVTGTTGVLLEAPFNGTLIASNANLILGIGSSVHTGAFVAQNIELQPGVSVHFHASSMLPRCDDGNACTGRDVLAGGVCIGQDPVLFGVPESDPTAVKCPDGSSPVGCRAYSCSEPLTGSLWVGGQWLAAPTCGPSYPTCTTECPATGCDASQPRNSDLVSCACSCTDPTGGPPFSVGVDGCATKTGNSCDQLCQTYAANACGAASSCRFGTCSKAAATTVPQLVAHDACHPGEELGVGQLADYSATVNAAASNMTVQVGGSRTVVPLSGLLGFHFDLPTSVGTNGRFVLGRLKFNAGTFGFFGRQIASPIVELTGGTAGDLSFIGAGRYSFNIGSQMLQTRVTATIGGVARAFDAQVPVTTQGTLDMGGRTIALSSMGTVPGGDTLTFQVQANLSNLPPTAQLQVLPSTPSVECTRHGGADVMLDASRSADPEGQSLRYQWFRRDQLARDRHPLPLANGVHAGATLPLGQSDVTVIVTDPLLASAKAETIVTVVDTTAPTIGPTSTVVFHVPPGGTQDTVSLTPPVVSDICDVKPTLQAFMLAGENLVEINFNQVTLSLGSVTIHWQATDEAGNFSLTEQIVTVAAADTGSGGTVGTGGGGTGGAGGTGGIAGTGGANGTGGISGSGGGITCAMPQSPPGSPSETVDVRVCVVGRINNGVRQGSNVWSTCADDTCTDQAIRDLLTKSNQPFLPETTFNYVGWKRIRDFYFPNEATDCAGPLFFQTEDPARYGSICFGTSTEPGQMARDCEATWGLPTITANDECVRGLVLVLAGSAQDIPCGETTLIKSAGGFSEDDFCTNTALIPPNITGQWSVVADTAGNCANTHDNRVAHELGHSLGLYHGNGLDDDCNGRWDEHCDVAESGENNPPTLMYPYDNGANYNSLTALQHDFARLNASKLPPNVGNSGDNCTPPAVPPLDDMGSSMPPTQSRGCACDASSRRGNRDLYSLLLASIVAAVVARMRRSRP